MKIIINIEADNNDLARVAEAFSVLAGTSDKIVVTTNVSENRKETIKAMIEKVEEEKKEATKTAEKVEEKKEIVKAEIKKEGPAADTGKKYTPEEVRAALAGLLKNDKKAVADILAKYDAKRLSDIKSEDFAAVMSDVAEVNV